jgi:hypothetical protein
MSTQPDRGSNFVWRRSSASQGDGACVEVAKLDSSVLVRDSRDQLGATLKFGQAQWRGFISRIKNGTATLG